MRLGQRATVIGIAWVVYGTSIILHEFGHVAAGIVVGGDPILISTTDVRGDWSSVSAAGLTAIGVFGSVVNVMLAALGYLMLRGQAIGSGTVRFLAWLLLAVNGFVVGMYMIVSPLFGFGDWSTILRQFEWHLELRTLTIAVGCILTLLWFHVVSRSTRFIVGTVPEESRLALSQELAMTSWLSAGSLGVAAALLSPLGLQWSVPIAVGSTMGTTWPMLPAARVGAGTVSVPGAQEGEPIQSSLAWMAFGIIVAGVFGFAFGPGIEV